MPLKELDSIPELRDDPSLRDFNDVPSLAKSLRETKAFVGSSIRPPGPDASPEAKKEFYDKMQKHAPHLVPIDEKDENAMNIVWGKLGRPTKPEEYDYKPPDGVDINLPALREAAIAAGMTKGQFEKLAAKSVAGAQAQSAQAQKEGEVLRTKWGAAFEKKCKDAAAVAQKLGQPPEVVSAIMGGKLRASSLEQWDVIATAVGTEGRGPVGQAGGGGGEVLTKDEAEARFREIQSHPGYFNRNHPEHDALVERGFKLQAMLHPD